MGGTAPQTPYLRDLLHSLSPPTLKFISMPMSSIVDTIHQVYVYDINTDQWGHLLPSGHHLGIPYIIGGKLVIIGGRLSATKKRTNKVSTFDEDSQTWTSYYLDLLSVRSSTR